MTPPDPSPDPPDDARDESYDDTPDPEEPFDERGKHWLSSLLRALDGYDRLEDSEGPERDRRRDSRSRLDLDISIGSLDALGDQRRREEPSRDERESPTRDERQPHRHKRRRRRRQTSTHASRNVSTRQYEDALEIVADISGTGPDDVRVGFDDSRLVIAVDGRELERVQIPWADPVADAAVKNGILTVEVTRESNEQSSPTSSDEDRHRDEESSEDQNE